MDSLTKARKKISATFTNSNSFNIPNVETTTMDYEQLKKELNRIISIAKSGVSVDGTKQSLFIFGPTGTGKTEIVKQVAEASGAIFHKLEPQKVPIEELQGFPYLHAKENGEKVVKLASPTILPPSGDKNLWVLFLDEFNKADTESMAAIMNLILNGEIGGFADFNEKTGKSEKYRLPERCVIIGAGNMAEQKGSTETNQVNNFDIATAERWHRVVYVDYNLSSWLESFALNEYTVKYEEKDYTFPSRVPSIVLNYLLTVYQDTGKEDAPFLIPKPIENEKEVSSTMSPRAWTLLSNAMISDFLINYKNPVEAFCNPTEQMKVLANNVAELGMNGKLIAEKIISSFKFNYDNNITPEEIFKSYKDVQTKMRKIKESYGMKTYYIVELADYIKNYGVFENQEKDFELSKKTLQYVANVSTFFADVEASAEDLMSFISTLNVGTNFGKNFSQALSQLNKKYATAYSAFIHTNFENL